MLDTKAAYSALLDNPKLDELLSQAKDRAEKLATTTSPSNEFAVRSAEVEAMAAKAAAAQEDLAEVLKQRTADRAEKVALAVHILKVASKLVG